MWKNKCIYHNFSITGNYQQAPSRCIQSFTSRNGEDSRMEFLNEGGEGQISIRLYRLYKII